MNQEQIFRGDIRICDFGAPQDHTIAKKRPVLVIQNNVSNKFGGTSIVTAIRTNPKVGQLPVGVKLEPGITGLEHTSYVDTRHIYTVDKNRIENKIGVIPPLEMEEVNNAIIISLGIIPYPR